MKFIKTLEKFTKEDVIKTKWGQIEIIYTDNIDDDVDLNEKIPIITAIFLYDDNNKGKGFGKDLYMKALDKYGVLYSTFPISNDAFNARESLVKSGLISIENINLGGIDFLKMTK